MLRTFGESEYDQEIPQTQTADNPIASIKEPPNHHEIPERQTKQGNQQLEFYDDLVYKLKKLVVSNIFSAQFIKIISHFKKIGYNINVEQQTACLVVNPITVGNFAFLFNFTPVGRTSDSLTVKTYLLMRW